MWRNQAAAKAEMIWMKFPTQTDVLLCSDTFQILRCIIWKYLCKYFLNSKKWVSNRMRDYFLYFECKTNIKYQLNWKCLMRRWHVDAQKVLADCFCIWYLTLWYIIWYIQSTISRRSCRIIDKWMDLLVVWSSWRWLWWRQRLDT